MYICCFCQHNTARVASTHMHHGIMSEFAMIPQELYTASGEMVSMYKSKQGGPAVDARTFSTDCFEKDLTTFRTQVGGARLYVSILIEQLGTVGAVTGRWKHALVRGRQASRAYVLAQRPVECAAQVLYFKANTG